mmetsp:Transcript_8839/g.22525  ORF Transcript_8839/g.22525 Transcript_8839/m.22525 type:complete len:221 (-) Transcript_8839:28-690(-)
MLVNLHVYDITNSGSESTNTAIQRINAVTRELSIGGIFHGGLEVMGSEWSFGFCETGSGVYAVEPKRNPMYTYRETVPLGITTMSPEKVKEVIRNLRESWPGASYDLLKRNCNDFCEALCQALGAGPFPMWVNRFARGADATVTTTAQVYDAASMAAREASALAREAGLFAQSTLDIISKSLFGVSGGDNNRIDGANGNIHATTTAPTQLPPPQQQMTGL